MKRGTPPTIRRVPPLPREPLPPGTALIAYIIAAAIFGLAIGSCAVFGVQLP